MSPPSLSSAEPLLEVRNLTIRYREDDRQVTAARDISFTLRRGGSLAIVGESGSGKSSVAGAILDFLGLPRRFTGAILFEGQDLAHLAPVRRRGILGRRIGAVFQGPFTSAQPGIARRPADRRADGAASRIAIAEALRRAEIALQEMGIDRPAEVARAFPHSCRAE